SPIAWFAFIGPVLAVVVVAGTHGVLGPDAGGAFGATLVGVGLVNVAWGGVAVWSTENTIAAWRYSFIADWGLALCGFGLTVADGRRAALLVIFSIVLCRLPLYVASRQALREKALTERPVNLVVAAALAGSAPFAGFAARVLLLRGATQMFWPLGLVLAVAMLLWLPGSLRLGRSLGLPRGRRALGVGPACCALQPCPRGGAQHRAGRRRACLHGVGRACANGRVRGRAGPAAGHPDVLAARGARPRSAA